MFKLDLEKAEEPEIKFATFVVSQKKQEIPEKNIYFCFIEYTKAFDCVYRNKLWKHFKEMGISPYLPLAKPVFRARSNSNWTWNNGLVPNWESSKSMLCTVTLLI